MAVFPVEDVASACAVCEKTFAPGGSRRRFCSDACRRRSYNRAAKVRRRRRAAETLVTSRVTRCAWCQGEFDAMITYEGTPRQVLRSAMRRYCSISCAKAREYKDKDYTRRAHLRKYGLTLEQYEALASDQGGVCAVCQQRDPDRALAVDHDHETGEVRGLLCTPCNRGIGFLRDDPDLLQRCANYLRGEL